jgi:hypothetical protein
MYRLFIASFSIIAFASCSNLTKNQVQPNLDDMLVMRKEQMAAAPALPAITKNIIIASKEDLIGYWIGFMQNIDSTEATVEDEYYEDNKINLAIDSIQGSNAFGHSVIEGIERPLKGTFSQLKDLYSFQLQQPGDEKFDGTFRFTISNSDSLIKGSWEPFNTSIEQNLAFELKKQQFQYSPETEIDEYSRYYDDTKSKPIEYGTDDETGEIYYDEAYFMTTEDVTKFNSSKKELKKEDVENLKQADIFILRNSIYARHGYAFRNKQLRRFFSYQEWYIPLHTQIGYALTDLEIKNIDLLLRYEEHAEAYFDVFGR